MKRLRALLFLLGATVLQAAAQQKNIIFIISDDHRYDAMGFMGKIPWLETPGLDRMAREGMHVKNAFVTTALCSPSRASVLTGLYAHTHTVVDNSAPEPENILYFPQLLQEAGYETAFFGKWHMGNQGDQPRKGFDHWEGLRGQGEYYNPTLNINGKRTKFTDSTYITDLLTDHALDWMKKQEKGHPFFVYLSHKGVHAMFEPAKRHRGKYADKPVPLPASYYLTATDEYKEHGIPEWVKEQRYSWHGVDYMYHGQIGFEEFYRRYLETLLSVDESITRVLDYLKANGLDKNTLVMYMGDNGFSFGEHGLIDKRHAYEESMRVPMIAMCPSIIKAGAATDALVQNIDVGPTLLEYAGVETPEHMEGESFLRVLNGTSQQHRDKIFYEYYWEYHYPQTPTMFAVRSGKYKYIHYYGLWTQNELYDLQMDPYEMNNLIDDRRYRELSKDLSGQVFDWLENTNGMQIPLKRNVYPKIDHKYKGQY